MNNSWVEKTLGELCTFKNGRAFKKTEWSEDGLPIIRIANLNKKNAGFNYFNGEYDESILIRKGDLLFSWSGTIGSSFGPHIWKSNDGLLNQHIYKVGYPNEIDDTYIFYLFLHITSELEKLTNGAVGLVHVKKSTLNSFKVKVAPPEEQKQIVAILDQAFAAIDQAQANIQQNIQNAQELFQSKLNQIFSQQGEGWEEKPLGEVCIVERGSSPRPIKNFITEDDDGVNWIKIGDVNVNDKYVYKTRQKITKEGAEKSRFVDVGDFILSNSMSYGRPYIMKIPGYIHDGWFVLRLQEGLDSDYFWQLLSSPVLKTQFENLSAGAIVKNISGDLVKKAMIHIPSIEEQKRIVLEANEISALTKKLEEGYRRKLNDLEELKKSLLQKAFSGELTQDKQAA